MGTHSIAPKAKFKSSKQSPHSLSLLVPPTPISLNCIKSFHIILPMPPITPKTFMQSWWRQNPINPPPCPSSSPSQQNIVSLCVKSNHEILPHSLSLTSFSIGSKQPPLSPSAILPNVLTQSCWRWNPILLLVIGQMKCPPIHQSCFFHNCLPHPNCQNTLKTVFFYEAT